jgi:hypothetical protein
MSEHEAGDVGAGDQQDHDSCREDDVEQRLHTADRLLAKRRGGSRQRESALSKSRWIDLLDEARDDRPDIAVRLHTVMPGASRATTLLLYMLPNAARSRRVKPMGTYKSAGVLLRRGPRFGNVKRRGITPMIVYGARLARSLRATPAIVTNRRCCCWFMPIGTAARQ